MQGTDADPLVESFHLYFLSFSQPPDLVFGNHEVKTDMN